MKAEAIGAEAAMAAAMQKVVWMEENMIDWMLAVIMMMSISLLCEL